MSFKQIIGQEKPIAILQNALVKNRLAHAYLFEGPACIGKVFTALQFIKAVNCLNLADGIDCCDQCISCKKIDAKNHIDINWISLLKTKSEISIEQIRQMQSQINLKPYEARYKVFCIHDAELMNEVSQSALLKTLEEPPLKSIIILTTSKSARLLKTIVSRCRLIRLSPLKINHIKDILAKRYNQGTAAVHFLSCISGSGLVDISSYASGDILAQKNRVIDEFNNFLNEPVAEPWFLKESNDYILWVLSVFLWWYRDILIFKETQSDQTVANKDRIKDLKTYAVMFSAACLSRIINIISETAKLIYKTNVNPKLAITVMTTDILNALSSTTIEVKRCLV